MQCTLFNRKKPWETAKRFGYIAAFIGTCVLFNLALISASVALAAFVLLIALRLSNVVNFFEPIEAQPSAAH